MSYAVTLDRSAVKDLGQLDPQVRRRITAAIAGLAADPRPVGCRAMAGWPAGHYRLRVGDWRVIYGVDDDARTVHVVKVGGRGQVYR